MSMEREDRLYAQYTGYLAVRVWRRDGARNLMHLAAAALNLEKYARPRLGAEAAAARLLAGEPLHTVQALFRLASPEEVAA